MLEIHELHVERVVLHETGQLADWQRSVQFQVAAHDGDGLLLRDLPEEHQLLLDIGGVVVARRGHTVVLAIRSRRNQELRTGKHEAILKFIHIAVNRIGNIETSLD